MEYSTRIEEVIKSASSLALTYSDSLIAPEHLLYGLLQLKDFKLCDILIENEITGDIIGDYICAHKVFSKGNSPSLTIESADILKNANTFAQQANMKLSPEHILLAIFVTDTDFLDFMENTYRIDRKEISSKLVEIMEEQLKSDLPSEILDLGTDLNKLAAQGKIGNIIGRDNEIRQIIEILSQKNKNNPLILGEAGVGKTAIIEYLAKLITDKKVPAFLQDKIIFSLNMSALISNTKYRGELEEKLNKFVEICKANPKIIVFVDEIHIIISSGNDSGEISPANILKPALARGEITIIGATTNKEYKKFIEEDNAFDRRFQPVKVKEPSKNDTLQILKFVRKGFEKHFGVKITDEALVTCVELSHKYIKDKYFPDKALNIIDSVCARYRYEIESSIEDNKKLIRLRENLMGMKYDLSKSDEQEKIKADIEYLEQKIRAVKTVIDEESIAQIISEKVNIPLTQLQANEINDLRNLENNLSKRVIGHTEIINKICNAIRRKRSGYSDSNKPIGSFLFLGPSGVGKTEIARSLASILFKDERKLIRINMNEYTESNTVNKLMGSPSGYEGSKEGGILTNEVLKNPNSVIVFDEFEKACKEVCNVLMTALDEGFMQDNQGKRVDFTNTIIIMTSNQGLDDIKKLSDIDLAKTLETSEYEQIFLNSAKKHFNLELLNRFDVISVFRPLSKREMTQIINLLLNKINNHPKFKEQNLKVRITRNAVNHLVEIKGMSLLNGVRPLKNIFEQQVIDKISNDSINDSIKNNSLVVIDYVDDQIKVEYRDE